MQLAALAVLTMLAAGSVWLSDGSPWMKAFLSALAVGHGARLLRREARRSACSILLRGDQALVRVEPDGELKSLHAVELRFRGRLASLSGRDSAGRRHRLLWWPDTLPQASRRALRLFADGRRDLRSPAPAVPA